MSVQFVDRVIGTILTEQHGIHHFYIGAFQRLQQFATSGCQTFFAADQQHSPAVGSANPGHILIAILRYGIAAVKNILI